MAKNLISGDTTTINENGNDIAVELNQEYVDFIDKDESLQTTAQTLTSAINELIPVVLYDSMSTAGSGSVESYTLSDSVSNYKYIDIFYSWGVAFGIVSTRIYVPGTTGGLNFPINLSQMVVGSSNLYCVVGVWTISGTTLSRTSEEFWRLTTNGYPTRTSGTGGHVLQIKMVVGYK